MTIKLLQGVQIYNFLLNLSDKTLPLKVSYNLIKIRNALKNDYNFYQQKINEYAVSYADRDEQNHIIRNNLGNICIIPDKINECNEKIQELENMDIEIKEDIYFSLEELESANLTFKEVSILFPFIKE